MDKTVTKSRVSLLFKWLLKMVKYACFIILMYVIVQIKVTPRKLLNTLTVSVKFSLYLSGHFNFYILLTFKMFGGFVYFLFGFSLFHLTEIQ